MRPIIVITGVLLVVCGSIAAVTGELDVAGSWIAAGGLAVVGLTGVFSVLSAQRQP